jgi:hypothetical protein
LFGGVKKEMGWKRRLGYFGIALIILIPSIIAAGLYWPDPVGNGLHLIFVKMIGEGGANLIVGLLTGLLLWGSLSGLNAGAVLIGTLIFGWILGITFKKLWDRRPTIMKTAQDKLYQHAPQQSLPQVNQEPLPVVNNPTQEEETKEAAAQ